MKRTVTETGLVRIEYHDQVWFELPGYTEIIFTRIHIETSHEWTRLPSPSGEVSKSTKSDN